MPQLPGGPHPPASPARAQATLVTFNPAAPATDINAPLALAAARAAAPEALVAQVLAPADPPARPDAVLNAVKVVRIALHCLDLQMHAASAAEAAAANGAAACLQRLQASGATRAVAPLLARPGTPPDARVISVGILEALLWHSMAAPPLQGPEARVLSAAAVQCCDAPEGPLCWDDEAERSRAADAAAAAVADAVASERQDARLAQAGSQFFMMLASSADGRSAAAASRGCAAVAAALRNFPAHPQLSEAALAALEAAVSSPSEPVRAAAAEALVSGGGLAAVCATLAREPDNPVLHAEGLVLFRECLGSDRPEAYAEHLRRCGAAALARGAVGRFRALVQMGVEHGAPQHPATVVALSAAAAVCAALEASEPQPQPPAPGAALPPPTPAQLLGAFGQPAPSVGGGACAAGVLGHIQGMNGGGPGLCS